MGAIKMVLGCVLAVVIWPTSLSAAMPDPCEINRATMWMADADNLERHGSDQRHYSNVKIRYQDALDVYDYGAVFRGLQDELVEWMTVNGSDKPHENLLHALQILNTGFAELDYGAWLAEAAPQNEEELKEAASRFVDKFISECGTGHFDLKTTEIDCGWFPVEYGVTCAEVQGMADCRSAEDFLYRVHAIRHLILDFKKDAVLATIRGIRLAADRWEHFLTDGKTMYPWEAGLNAWWVGGGTTQRPPLHQWILLHPQLAASVSSESFSDLRARDAFCVEVLGHLWYGWHDECRPEEGLGWWGLTAVAMFRDDMRPGVGFALEYGRTLTLGVAWHDDDEDDDWFDNAPYVVMSVDLLSFTRETATQYGRFTSEAENRLQAISGW
jgi:hypothetical protein